MKRKLLSLLLVGAMTATMFAGCGGGSDEPAADNAADDAANDAADDTADDAADDTADDAADDTADDASDDSASSGGGSLTVYAWDASFNIPALQAAADDYKANVNPDFSLEIVEQSGSSDVEQAITLAGSSGDYSTLPDIVLFQDHYIQNYVADYPDAWQSIDGIDIDWNDFSAEKLDYSTIDGVHYGVPVDNGNAVCAYRVDLLEQCGYTIDDLTGCTWEKFIEIGEKVYAETGKHLMTINSDGNDLVYIMLQAEGESQFKDGEPYITENETLVKIVDILVEMAQKNVLYLANSWSDYCDQAIVGDMVAGVMNGNWILPTISKVEANSGKWELTSIPTIEGGEGYASNGGSSLYLTSNCKDAELAKDFLAYTFGGSTETYDNALRNGGVVTTCISAGKSDVYNEGVAFFNDQPIYSKIVEMGANVPIVEQNNYHYSARNYIGTAIINILQNGYSTADALKEAEEQLRFEMGL